MKVVLVNPKDGLERTSVSISVGIGSQDDLKDYKGFTHLLEHILFLGSKNFEKKAIDKTVNTHNGSKNGVTKDYKTSYFFELDSDGASDLILKVIDALFNPTLTYNQVKSEVNNVNSEISM